MASVLSVCYDTTTGKYLVQSIGSAQIAAGAVLSSQIGSGQVGLTHLASGVGQALVSGFTATIAQIVEEPSYTANQLLSGYLCVQFITSGVLDYCPAMNVSGMMPAIGVMTGNVLSGQTVTFQRQGRMTNAGWNFSGYIGQLVYVGTSSEVRLMVSGLMISGFCAQRLGKTVSPTTVWLSPDLTYVQEAQ